MSKILCEIVRGPSGAFALRIHPTWYPSLQDWPEYTQFTQVGIIPRAAIGIVQIQFDDSLPKNEAEL